jgi:hypothetical protein
MARYISVQEVVNHFAGIGGLPFPTDRPYIYAEVGLYKPFHGSTIAALRKRGFQVVNCSNKWGVIPDVYYIYDKGYDLGVDKAV